MTQRVAITGVGLISPSVNSVRDMAAAYAATEGRYPPQTVNDIPAPEAAAPRELRRMARLTRLALYAADTACRNAGVISSPECGIIVGLTHGTSSLLKEFHDYWFDYGPQMASPVAFSNGVTNAPLGAVSKHCGLTAGGMTVVGAENCGMETLGLAARSVIDGDYRYCCAGGAEEYSQLVADAYRNIGWFCREAPPFLPYTGPSRGFGLSEGSCFFVTAKEQDVRGKAVFFSPLTSLDELDGDPDVILSGAAGGPQDRFEREAIAAVLARCKSRPHILFSKCFFGETFSAGALFSAAMAWDILANGASYPAYPLDPDIGYAHPAERVDGAQSVLVISSSRSGETFFGLFSKRSFG